VALVNARELSITAAQKGYAVGAFNITNLIQLEGVVEAHEEMKAPLIIQTSVTPAKFLGEEVIVSVFRAIAESSSIPICLHLDHCQDIAYCKKCADTGWTNIMIDASREAYVENIRRTKEVVEYCHAASGISVEGELGTVSGVEDQIKVVEDESKLCDPEQVLDYVKETGVDLLAPAIGTAHGVYKTKDPKVDFERFKKISDFLNKDRIRTPLVIHGGTGLPEHTVKRLVELGGSKFNVSTDLKRTWINAVYEYISANREEYNPGKLDKHAKQATKERVKAWIAMLGSAGRA